MTWAGFEPFDNNTGQFHAPAPPVTPSGTTTGALAFTGGLGVATFPNTGTYNAQAFYLDGPGDPIDNSFVAIDSVSFVGQVGNIFNVNDLCVIKDGNNCIFIDTAVGSATIRMGANFAGGRYYSTSVAITAPVLPYTLALSWVGNVFSAWTLISGTWTNWVSWDVTAMHDFTAPGGWAGWRPGFIPACQPGYTTITVDNLRWDLTSNLVQSIFAPPTGLGAAVVGGPAVVLGWQASVPSPGNPLLAPLGYNVYRDGVLLANVTVPGVVSYIDSTVIAGMSYTYTVTAANGDLTDASGPSNPVTASTSPVFVFGKFAAAPAYPPIMLINAKGIKPKIYPPVINPNMRSRR